MKKQIIRVGNQELNILVDTENKMVQINKILFEKQEDFIYLVNKLTDIAEEFLEENVDN